MVEVEVTVVTIVAVTDNNEVSVVEIVEVTGSVTVVVPEL
jgi:hypothetical protein